MTTTGFSWAHGSGAVQRLGGMLGPVTFRLPDGRAVQPFQVAPWDADPGLPGVLRQLRGEWPCVPFGLDQRARLSGDWAGLTLPDPRPMPAHGHGSNHDWTFAPTTDGSVALSIDYPADDPIARLDRRIRPDPAAPALDIDLTVHPRRDVALPIGLHPTLRIPDGGLVIETASGGMTFPAEVEPGVSVLAHGARFDSLARVPRRDGGAQDLTRLPLPFATEEIVQLTAPGGTISVLAPGEGFRVTLTWDAGHFPGMTLWLSNRGRTADPWLGRHLALGVEPICGPFDLGPRVAVADNPLARAGHRTAHAFRAGEAFHTTLRIAVTAA